MGKMSANDKILTENLKSDKMRNNGNSVSPRNDPCSKLNWTKTIADVAMPKFRPTFYSLLRSANDMFSEVKLKLMFQLLNICSQSETFDQTLLQNCQFKYTNQLAKLT